MFCQKEVLKNFTKSEKILLLESPEKSSREVKYAKINGKNRSVKFIQIEV